MGTVRAALLVGATGLVGSHLLRRLLAHPGYARVSVWARREVPLHDPKLTQTIVDFERLAQRALGVEDVYVALGTTITAAGSQQAFYRVDHDYPLQLARLARERGVQRFLMVSALGANPDSRVFYNRVKGETEDAIRGLELPKVWFFRPSLLVGERQEYRRGEKFAMPLGKAIAPLLVGALRKYRPIEADAVAAAMVYAATRELPPGVVESDEISWLAALP
jgi:uncharacterized protein YbjT (DUF2867 family)